MIGNDRKNLVPEQTCHPGDDRRRYAVTLAAALIPGLILYDLDA